MAKPKPKNQIKPELTPEQKQIKAEIDNQIQDVKDGIIDSLDRQETSYGKNKSHSWNNIKYSAKDAMTSVQMGTEVQAMILSNRIFDESGYSIEVKSSLLNGKNPGNLKTAATIVGLSTSTKRDKDGFIEHTNDSKEAYIILYGSRVAVEVPDGKKKENRIDSVAYSAGETILDSEKMAKEYKSIDTLEWTGKINEELAKVDPKFPELFEAVLSNRDKQFVDAQPDNTTVLQDALNRKAKLDETLNKNVTTENVKQTRGILAKLLGKDKEQEKNQGR